MDAVAVDQRLVHLAHAQADHRPLYRMALARIHRMSEQHGGDPDALIAEVSTLYVQASPYLGLWVVVHEASVCGHGLAKIERFDGRLVCWITQVEMDAPASAEVRRQWLSELGAWVNELNAQLAPARIERYIMATQRTPRRAGEMDGWTRHAGFNFFRALYAKEVT